jgi:dTDP-D-glucose 4,6-dehydratase
LITDSTRIRRELGYNEAIPFDEALKRTIAWERANPPATIDAQLFDYAAEDALLASLKDR